MREPVKWYDANATDNPPWIKALAEVRHLACREGGVTTMSKRSSSRSISMPSLRLVTPTSF
jgi:hypothetical protein